MSVGVNHGVSIDTSIEGKYNKLKELREVSRTLPAIIDRDENVEIMDIVDCGEITDSDGNSVKVYALLEKDKDGKEIYTYYDENNNLLAGKTTVRNQVALAPSSYLLEKDPENFQIQINLVSENHKIQKENGMSLVTLEKDVIEMNIDTLKDVKQRVDLRHDTIKAKMSKLSGQMLQKADVVVDADTKVSSNTTMSEAIQSENADKILLYRGQSGAYSSFMLTKDGKFERLENLQYSTTPTKVNVMTPDGTVTPEEPEATIQIANKDEGFYLKKSNRLGESGKQKFGYYRGDRHDPNLSPIAGEVETEESKIPTSKEESVLLDRKENPDIDPNNDEAGVETKEATESAETRDIDDNPYNDSPEKEEKKELEFQDTHEVVNEFSSLEDLAEEYDVDVEEVRKIYKKSAGITPNEKYDNTVQELKQIIKEREDQQPPENDPRSEGYVKVPWPTD